VLATFDGKLQALVVTRNFLHGLDPETGKEYWRYETHKQSSGNVYAASPVVSGNYIFLSAWYRLGARVLRVKDDQLEKLWSGDSSLSTHYANAIIYNEHIYGFHGHAWERGGPTLRCIELASGKVLWAQPQDGSGTLVRFADNLLILRDTGELQLAKANPQGFKVQSRAQVVGRTTRSYPAIADGYVFVKGPRQLVCLDLRAQK
jgi:outer membrane protein assembly factor BamB